MTPENDTVGQALRLLETLAGRVERKAEDLNRLSGELRGLAALLAVLKSDKR